MTEVGPTETLAVGDVLEEAWRLYRAFFARSAALTLVVFGALGAFVVQGRGTRNDLVLWLMFLVPVVGTAVVQGVLVEAVDDERHQGGARLRRGRRLGALLGLSLLTGVGVGLGLLALFVPGVFLFTAWSLSVPALVIEGRSPRDAMRRSRQLVRGQFWSVLRLLLAVGVQTALVAIALHFAFGFMLGASHAKLVPWLTGSLAGAFATPYTAHAVTVAYYRLTAGETRTAETARPWTSAWDEA